MDFNERRVSSNFGYHASITDLLLIDVITLQITVISSSIFVSVTPYSLTCWMAMSSESYNIYILNAKLRNIPLFFVSLMLDLGLK